MSFFWQNPALQRNPRLKRWVSDIVQNKAAYERAVGVRLGELLGCGHWGCVFASDPPWVVKFTIDPNEGPIWQKIIKLVEEEDYGGSGFTRVQRLVRIEPGVMYGGRRRRLYAIVREEIAPVFESIPRSGMVALSPATKQAIGLPPEYQPYRATMVGYPTPIVQVQLPDRTVRGQGIGVDDLEKTMNGLGTYRQLAHQWFRAPSERSGLHGQLERATYRMGGFVGDALGDSLRMLLSNEVVLRDLHSMNIGWRVHQTLPGFGYENRTIVIFDPGHTPTDKRVPIETALLQSNPAEWWGAIR